MKDDYFNATMQQSAIKCYLQGFGYKVHLDTSNYSLTVRYPVGDLFVLKRINDWKMAREFIAEQSQQGVVILQNDV